MISSAWLKALRLNQRHSPEFICNGDDVSSCPHSPMIRQIFELPNVAAVHCISDVPSIVFMVLDEINQAEIDQAHKSLWNQGLATLLMVISSNTLHVYSLSQLPIDSESVKTPTDRLVDVLNRTHDALLLKDLVLGVESGRYVAANAEKFDSSNRIDQVLLSNLEATVKRLTESGLAIESAQALLMQVMFIAYLEDKGIVNSDYFVTATRNSNIKSLTQLLEDGRESKFHQLFKLLKKHFNGDLFVAPCSFDASKNGALLQSEHIKVLAEFRSGGLNLETGQYHFWPYDFRYIPVELISAVYDRFLASDANTKRETGAYYTPMFLADTVVEQAWSELSPKQKAHGCYVDPSCGSGIFLVRLFDKAVEQWRIDHNYQRPLWPSLLAILKRINGFDIKKESIRVAAFSLYIALLENTRPAEILKLMAKGRLLPRLHGNTLLVNDFFNVPSDEHQFDLVIGNPPWVSRRGEQNNAVAWCKENNQNMPGKEIAWGFAWKALRHCKKDGVIALLLKATSFLTNHSPTFLAERKQWLNDVQVKRIINFADMCFQLFDNGSAPTALMIYKPLEENSGNYRFDYWVPKSDLNLKTKRLLTLSSADKASLPIELVQKDHLLMKRRMWMQTPDAKLYQWLNGFPDLSHKLITFQDASKKDIDTENKWVIGRGFQRAQSHRVGEPGYATSISKGVTKIPYLDMKMFREVVLPTIKPISWHTDIVHRRGFEDGFKAPHILIPQGIERNKGRLRASYCIQDLTFLHSLQAISFDKDEHERAKFLTVLLNSSLVAWFLFHHSSNTGMERDKVHQEQLLDIPFPLPEQLDNPSRARKALNEAVALIDQLLDERDELLQDNISSCMADIDNIVYRYFDLTSADISLIEDALHYIIPSMQPRAKSKKIPPLWECTTERDWKLYGECLAESLGHWLSGDSRAVTEFVGSSPDLSIVGVRITDDKSEPAFQMRKTQDIDLLLEKIWKALPTSLPGNFQLIPDLRIFIDDVLYLVKPRKRRFWLASTALADSDAIATEILGLTR
ncbi:class I SAM-dependent DNA methyltransferase [Pseudomonadota bacterium]